MLAARTPEQKTSQDAYMEKLQKELAAKQELLTDACEELSKLRKENAKELAIRLKEALINR